MLNTTSVVKRLHLLLALLFFGSLWGGAADAAQLGATAQSEQKIAQKEVKLLKLVPWSGKPGSAWKEYDKAVKEQKYERAYEIAEGNLNAARTSQNSEAWVRALIRCVQTRIALHGYETAVKFLKEETWPEDLLAQTTLHLYYAQALLTYAHEYSWEIRGREKVDSKGTVDLKGRHLSQQGPQVKGIDFIRLSGRPAERIRKRLRVKIGDRVAQRRADRPGVVVQLDIFGEYRDRLFSQLVSMGEHHIVRTPRFGKNLFNGPCLQVDHAL